MGVKRRIGARVPQCEGLGNLRKLKDLRGAVQS